MLVGTSAPIALVVARSASVALDANAVLQQLLTRFGGRGGGKPDLAQGAGLAGDPQDDHRRRTGADWYPIGEAWTGE